MVEKKMHNHHTHRNRAHLVRHEPDAIEAKSHRHAKEKAHDHHVHHVEDFKKRFADIIRPESKQAIATLKQMGIRCMMLTGDNNLVAKWVADELQLDEYFAEVLPQEKAANAFAIPLAAGALYQSGILLSPAMGAVLMSLSTVIVAINAKFLRVVK